ncbi:MAG: Hsp20/alpha crystallin family protein [Sphingomonadaceae bacterium]
MSISRYDPLTRLMTLRDAVDRIFDEAFGRTGIARMATGTLPIDMFERDDELIIQAAVPGARPEDVDISVTSDTLTIKATVHTEAEKEESKNWNWYFHELDHGQVTRTVSLPFQVSSDQADARFENGMLHLRLPKSREAMPRRIKVQMGSGQAQQIGVTQQGGD